MVERELRVYERLENHPRPAQSATKKIANPSNKAIVSPASQAPAALTPLTEDKNANTVRKNKVKVDCEGLIVVVDSG